jgi:hypothetical protein
MLLKRIRAALGMGLIWAISWAPLGLVVGLVLGGNPATPDGFPADDWVMPLAALGFLGGTIFSSGLRLAAGNRSFHQLSLPRFGVWGAMGGVVLGVLATALWQLDTGWGPVFGPGAAVLIGASTLLSAGSATGSLALARMGEGRRSLDSGPDTGDPRPFK